MARWSILSNWVDDGVSSATVWWILQSCECALSSVTQSCLLNPSDIIEGILKRIRWFSGGVMVRRVNFLHFCWSRIAGGGGEASNSIGMIVQNTPRIRLQAVFWSLWSLSMYPCCPLHQASAP